MVILRFQTLIHTGLPNWIVILRYVKRSLILVYRTGSLYCVMSNAHSYWFTELDRYIALCQTLIHTGLPNWIVILRYVKRSLILVYRTGSLYCVMSNAHSYWFTELDRYLALCQTRTHTGLPNWIVILRYVKPHSPWYTDHWMVILRFQTWLTLVYRSGWLPYRLKKNRLKVTKIFASD